MNVITNNNLRCTVALAALENVLDPEIGLNVVDLGLIYGLEFDEAQPGIVVTMTLTTPHCPMGGSITNAVEQVMSETFAGYKVYLNLTFQPPWNYDRISETGKKYLSI